MSLTAMRALTDARLAALARHAEAQRLADVANRVARKAYSAVLEIESEIATLRLISEGPCVPLSEYRRVEEQARAHCPDCECTSIIDLVEVAE